MVSNQQPEIKDWKRMWFKENKVWMATDDRGMPVVKDGRVLIKYQVKQAHEYWVNRENVRPLDSPPVKSKHSMQSKSANKTVAKRKSTAVEPPPDRITYEDKICVFTDGASSGNPGPSGIGVLLRYGGHEKEISRFIGTATNNIAELKAIEAGLSALKHTDIPVRLFTDSKYAYGILALNWKAKKNQEIVAAIKKNMSRFKDLQFIKVRGHSGHPENERADVLATSAIAKNAAS